MGIVGGWSGGGFARNRSADYGSAAFEHFWRRYLAELSDYPARERFTRARAIYRSGISLMAWYWWAILALIAIYFISKALGRNPTGLVAQHRSEQMTIIGIGLVAYGLWTWQTTTFPLGLIIGAVLIFLAVR